MRPSNPLYDLNRAGHLLRETRAEQRAEEAEDFHAHLAAYIAETEELRAAGRPLTERKIPPPGDSPYRYELSDGVADFAIGASNIAGIVGLVGLAAFALFAIVIVLQITN